MKTTWALCAAFVALSVVPFRSALAQDTEGVAKVRDLNKKAVDAYENLEIEDARKFLMQALEMCAAEGLNKNPIKATTHLNLGVVMVGGLKQRDAGTKQFRRALEIDPHIKVPKRLSSPEIQAAFDAAVRGEGEEPGAAKPPAVATVPPHPAPVTPPPATKPAPVATTPPPASTAPATTLSLVHEPMADAPVGSTLTLRARVQGNGRFDKLVLAYRPEAASDFLARDMDKESDGEYVARIPEVATKGASVAYYIEARGRGGQALARNGSPDSPHIVALSGETAGVEASAGETPGAGKKDEGGSGQYWLSLGLGVGGGYAKGHPEVNPNYPDPNNQRRALPIEFSNVAAAKLLHFNPELGYFLSPTLMLSIQGRLQVTTGASEVHFDTCTPNKVCQPASGAVAVLAKATKLLDPRGPLQPYVSLSAGAGYIRYLVDISSFKLMGCGNEEGTNCYDTVAGGGFLFGPSVGGWLHMTGPVFLTGALSALIGLPNTALNVDLNLGLGYRL
jgi:hypothetical protein